jgi:hypothetical protein
MGKRVDMSSQIRICKKCDIIIDKDVQALKSLMDGHWICKPCFEVKLGKKI